MYTVINRHVSIQVYTCQETEEMTSLLLNAIALLLVFPINNFFPYNWNKPTFASSCLKLLLNIWVTLSNETVRGSMKFSNSSSSSPTGKETKTNQQKHHIIFTLLFRRVSLLGFYRKISLTSWEVSYDLQEQKPEVWHIFTEL